MGGSEQTTGGVGGTRAEGVRFVLIGPADLPSPTPSAAGESFVNWVGASADGSVLAGFLVTDDSRGAPNGVRFFWSSATGTVTVPSGSPDSGLYVPTSLTADGKTLLGAVYAFQELNDASNSRVTYPSSFYWWNKERGDQPFGPPEPMYEGNIDYMSADGTTALGSVTIGPVVRSAEDEADRRSFRWQRGKGFEYLSSLGGWPAGGEFNALSGDGQVIAGWVADGRPFIWREPNRVVTLADAPSAFPYCYVQRLSQDGSAAFGPCYEEGADKNMGFRWTAETGLMPIGLPGYVDATLDGRVAASSDGLALYRWTAETGAIKLKPPSDWIGNASSYSLDIYPGCLSEEGGRIRGRLSLYEAGRAEPTKRSFQWTQSDGFVSLEPLPGHALSSGGMQARDGSVVLGASYPAGAGSPAVAVLWDCKGVRDIARELSEAGTDLQGVSLQGVRLAGASYIWVGSSLMVAGGALLASGGTAAWIAWLPNRCQ
jgi:hypothetical protein